MKEFEAKVVIVCIILCAIILGLGIIFDNNKIENEVKENTNVSDI